MEKFDLDSYLEKRYSGLPLERIKKAVFDYEDLLEAVNSALNLACVSNQRELLIAFMEWLDPHNIKEFPNDESVFVDEFLSN